MLIVSTRVVALIITYINLILLVPHLSAYHFPYHLSHRQTTSQPRAIETQQLDKTLPLFHMTNEKV